MWILKNSKEFLDHLKSPEIEKQTRKYYSKLLHIQNGNRKYKLLVLGHFVKEHSDSKHKYFEDDITKRCLSF